MKHNNHKDIFAIIVTYNPDKTKINTLFGSLVNEVGKIIVVDNSDEPGIKASNLIGDEKNRIIIDMGYNTGIATAINAGLHKAVTLGAKNVILFDQDSKPGPGMIDILVRAYDDLTRNGKRVSSLGPRFHDHRRDTPTPFIRIRQFRLIRSKCKTGELIPVDYLITSGCLIPVSCLSDIGFMREDLFIDYVDIEWGLRANTKGYQAYGVCDAVMEHSLGEEPLRLMGLELPTHNVIRNYYMFRNAVALYKSRDIPLMWKFVDGYRLCIRFVIYSGFLRPRIKNMFAMSKGLLHGIMGKMGKYQK